MGALRCLLLLAFGSATMTPIVVVALLGLVYGGSVGPAALSHPRDDEPCQRRA